MKGRQTRPEARNLATHPVHLGPGDYAINPPGIWHTADIADAASALFRGSEYQPR